jgi:arylformamidase
VHSALAISGLIDLESIRRTPFLATDLRLTESSAERLSPAWIPAPEQGHLYAVHGDQESAEFARQTVLIQSSWGRDRVPIASALPGLNHFSILESLLNFDGPLFKLMLNMLQSSR